MSEIGKTRVPHLPALRSERGNLIVWCRYCNLTHLHDGEYGQRTANCPDGSDSPYLATGYFLYEDQHEEDEGLGAVVEGLKQRADTLEEENRVLRGECGARHRVEELLNEEAKENGARIAALEAQVERLGGRRFPLQKSDPRKNTDQRASVPWSIGQRAWDVYAIKYSNGQSCERIAERGGFGNNEMDTFLPGWREMADAIVRGDGHAVQLKAALEVVAVDRQRIMLAPTQTREAGWVWVVSEEAMQKLDTARAAAKGKG